MRISTCANYHLRPEETTTQADLLLVQEKGTLRQRMPKQEDYHHHIPERTG